MTDNVNRFIETLYDDRIKSIIIGLTGRTGSGCTSVAKIINKLFNGDLPEPKKECHSNIDDRKYKVVHKYFNMQREKYRKNIQVIKTTDIICSFILEKGHSEFIKYLEHIEKINNPTTITNFEKGEYKELIDNLNNQQFIDKFEKCKKECDVYPKELDNFKILLTEQMKKYQIQVLRTEGKNAQAIRRKANLYTYLFQNIGDNIRATGDPYHICKSDSFKPNPDSIYSIANKIKKIIDTFINSSNYSIIIIDAIRNPFEVLFFRDIFNNFYLFNITKTDTERRESLLRDKGMETEEIEDIEKREFVKIDHDNYFKINISKCIELADIHLYNPRDKYDNKEQLKKNLIRYFALIMHPGLITPTNIERCMKIANDLKVCSGCLSLQVGSVVTNDRYNIISTGWNTVPDGQIPCNLRNMEDLVDEEDNIAFSKYELEDEEFNNYLKLQFYLNLKKTDFCKKQFHQYCFKDAFNCYTKERNQIHTKAIHAEEMALLNGSIGLRNGKIFTTSKPCELCAKKSFQAGIREIYYINQYSGISEDNIINCGTNQPKMIIFNGITASAFDKLYTRLIACDKEQSALTGFSFKESNQEISVNLFVNNLPVYISKEKESCFLKADNNCRNPETFEVDMNDRMLVLKNSEKYVCSDRNENDKLNCNREKIQTWEKFKLQFKKRRTQKQNTDAEFALQSLANNKYVKLNNGYLQATEDFFNEDDGNMIIKINKLT